MMRRLLLSVLLFLVTAAAAAAQAAVDVRGRLIDADGNPIADERVVLHRVVGMAGANIAETRTDKDGRFTIPVDSADNPEAAYFLAARWEGELYIGEAFRAPFGTAEHLLQVGVPGTSASALIDGTAPATQGAMRPAVQGSPATRTNWLLFAIPAIALLGVVVYFVLRGRARPSPRRALLREIAELDLAYAANPTDDYRAERAALIARLREASA